MPKITDYPRASLKNSLELAEAVEGFGGKCSEAMAADALHKKVSGAFHALIGAAGKYDLVTKKSGQLETTPLFRSLKLAYDKSEADEKLQEAFLSPPLFNTIYEQFKGLVLPIGHFEKLLIREFEVPDNFASRVSKYFIEGARQTSLLGEGNKLQSSSKAEERDEEEEYEGEIEDDVLSDKGQQQQELKHTDNSHYAVRITGPGTNFALEINEADDLLIVQAMLKKIEKKFAEDI